ncbi:uncharacterized protein IL334_002952 [Kwoniella shivajii]|uniref:Zinc finger PHD-type domain-containing protein n=1 Tax=Kwoniella shivajii TaxID=564305 RepID=A0ABZ1CWJ5_9TREE|nr:hypothetical protein IL334_002952 [Kwoniella shivajii]
MPRKNPIPLAVAPVEALLPPVPPSPIIQTLRKDWRWAAISQFVWTFSDAFGLVDWDIENLEADFDGDEKALIPTLIAKLLFALTYNRQINRDNAFENLRRTYAKRKPDDKCLLGTEEVPVSWDTLGLSQKVQILHELCEWQLEDPARFRGLLKSEDDAVTWRVEPVGWDKDGNTYWLFDDNRLWIQRFPPPPPTPPKPAKKTSQKAKKAAKKSRPSIPLSANKKSNKRKDMTPESSPTPPPAAKEEEVLSGSRRRKSVNFYGNPTPTAQALKRNPITPHTPLTGGSTSSRPTRSNARLNHNQNPNAETSESPSKTSKTTPASLGTRVSRRLRNVDDEWQQVPEDWLSTPAKPRGRAKGKGKGKAKQVDGEGDESELSELTDEEEHERLVLASGARKAQRTIESDRDDVTGTRPEEDEQEEKMDVDLDGDMEHQNGDGSDVQIDIDQGENAEVEDKHTDQPEEKVIDETEKTSPPAVEAAETNGHTSSPVAAPETKEAEPPADAIEEDEQTNTAMPKEESAPAADESDVRAVNGENGDGNTVHTNGEVDKHGIKAGSIEGDASNDEKAKLEEELAKEIKAEPVKEKSDLILAWEADRSHIPAEFVEWETVCVSLYEWRTFPEQFAKSKDLDEQALYSLLTEEVGPTIITILVGKEQERLKQEAINNRKRSSRIATRELEREEILKREAAEREMEERMEKIRSEEIKKQKEEEEALAREKARDERLREREERAQAREEAVIKKAEEETREREKRERKREKRKRRREGEEVSDDSDDEIEQHDRSSQRARTRTGTENGTEPPNERWELNCEVCKKVGWNIDEDLDLVCCDDCGRWQHTECHDRLDIREGRGKRNWDQVDFQCKECRLRAARNRQRHETHQQQPSPVAQSQTNGHSNSHPHPLSQSYPVIPGSAPLPQSQTPLNPARPPPPPLNPGEFYLPYPHPPAKEDRPAGYAVFYPPNQNEQQPQRSPPQTVNQGPQAERVQRDYLPQQSSIQVSRPSSVQQNYPPQSQSASHQSQSRSSHQLPHVHPSQQQVPRGNPVTTQSLTHAQQPTAHAYHSSQISPPTRPAHQGGSPAHNPSISYPAHPTSTFQARPLLAQALPSQARPAPSYPTYSHHEQIPPQPAGHNPLRNVHSSSDQQGQQAIPRPQVHEQQRSA